MAWVVSLILGLALGLAAAIFLLRPLRIARDPGREGAQDREASRAYDLVSRWPVFSLERFIVLRALARLLPRGRLLDIGCGPAYLAAQLSRRLPLLNVLALDNNRFMLDLARRNWPPSAYTNLDYLLADGQKMPLADASLDVVVSSISLHHWPDAGLVFSEIERVLKPGGRFLVFDLRRDTPAYFYAALRLGQAFFSPAPIRRTNGAIGSIWAAYTPAEVRIILQKTRLQDLNIGSQFGWMIIRGSKSEKLPS